MSNSKKTHELIRQNEQIVKKSQKHDANLQKNSTIYFQIGLIVCLLAVYGLFEMTFETTVQKYDVLPPIEDPLYVDVPVINPKVPEFVEIIEQKKSKSQEHFKEVPNETPLETLKKEFVEPTIDFDPPVDPGKVFVEGPPKDETPVPFVFVEEVPIYPGCENKKTNDDRKQCMSDKITKLIQKKFNTGLGSDLGLSGKQVIRTQFKIDKTGHVSDIHIQSTHPKLDEEAERVINIIPEMIPGKQRDKPVGVIYTLPIVFQVE